jgi:hypothetical protein
VGVPALTTSSGIDHIEKGKPLARLFMLNTLINYITSPLINMTLHAGTSMAALKISNCFSA